MATDAATSSSPTGQGRSQPRQASGETPDLVKDEDIRVALSVLAKCTDLAVQGRMKDQPTLCVKHLERALSISKPLERFTTVALATAKARLNLSAALSRAGRHNDAMSSIKTAQDSIEQVLSGRTKQHPRTDPDLAMLVEQAHAFQVAAIIAEGIEVEGFNEASGVVSTTEEPSLQEQIYADACAWGEAHLRTAHPIFTLANKLHSLSAVRAEADGLERKYAGTRPPGESNEVRPSALAEAGAAFAQVPPAASAPSTDEDAFLQHGLESQPQSPSEAACLKTPQARSKPKAKKVVVETLGPRQRALLKKDAGGRGNVFADYLRDIEIADEERRAGFHDVQEESRKNLKETSRMSKIQMMVYQDDHHIHDIMYTPYIHKLRMQQMGNINMSRSDPLLLKEAQHSHLSPEVVNARKFRKKLQEEQRALETRVQGPRYQGLLEWKARAHH